MIYCNTHIVNNNNLCSPLNTDVLEYITGQDPRGMPGYMGFSPFMDHIRMAGMYPPNSRER